VSSSFPLDGRGFDVLVVGGGINGVAIARQLARERVRVFLVEQNDFGSGATSRSTRIIHGGLRYLEQGEIGLVRESLAERERIMRDHPHLVRPQDFLLALPRKSHSLLRTGLAVRTGLWLYQHWAGGSNKSQDAARRFEAELDAGNAWAVYSYEDAQCEFPERLVAEWLVEATSLGAVARNHTEALEITRAATRVSGARLRDRISGQEYAVSARWVVNASGPWVDAVVKASAIASQQLVGGMRGSHLVFPKFPGAPEQAVYAEAADGRQVFILPWNKQLLVGTTEVLDSDDPGEAQPSQQEIDYLYQSLIRIFPHCGLTKSDIHFSFAGVRPLPYAPGRKYSSITRRHILHDHTPDGAAGMISVIGGKLTTAARLARDVGRKLGLEISEPNAALSLVEHGDVESAVRQWAHAVAAKAGIRESCAEGIAEWHGRQALAVAHAASTDERLRAPICSHSCHLVAEAVEAVAHESAVTLGDILLRRVPVALGACWSKECGREAAQKIGAALGWDSLRMGQELEGFEEERRKFLHPRGDGSCSIQIGDITPAAHGSSTPN
jgi:glycerol-3-phosphate dehydrogenase